MITGIAKRLYLERKYDFEDQAHYFQLKIDAMTTSAKRAVFDTGLFGGGMVTLFMIMCAGIIGAAPSKCISGSDIEGAAKNSSVAQLQQPSWAPPPPATDHGGEKQDLWKQHICSMPCIDCNQLLIACTDLGAEGACILHKSRCNYVSNYTKREEYSLCEQQCDMDVIITKILAFASLITTTALKIHSTLLKIWEWKEVRLNKNS